MAIKKTIGELIENEVRKQQIPITEFAKMIYCQRNNVYDIFKRSKMDIVQLKQISKVLNRNFFKVLSEDVELINEVEESEVEEMNRKAVSQFLGVVPDVLHKLGKQSAIVFSDMKDSGLTPDFGLSNYFITFTIGETLKERIGNIETLPINSVVSKDGCIVEVCTNIIYGSVCINIRLDYKTFDEWYRILVFAFEIYAKIGRI